MNRRKRTSSLGFPSLVLLVIAVIIVSSSGIGYVVMKNKQFSARSKIAKVQKKMEEHQVSIALHQSDIDESLGIFRLREELVDRKSSLREIRYVEVYQDPSDEKNPDQSVAQR